MKDRVLPPVTTIERHSRHGGFTRIDVAMIVLLVALVIGVGLPTYAGTRSRADDRAAQTSLENSLAAATVLHRANNGYDAAGAAGLTPEVPGITFLRSPLASTGPEVVSIDIGPDGSSWGVAALSDSGTCFFLRALDGEATRYDSSETAACTGTQALVVNGFEWTRPGPVVTVADGEFEEVEIAPPHGWEDYAVGQQVGGWTVFTGAVSHHGAIHRDLASGLGAPGGQHLDLRALGGVEQTISGLRSGWTYTLTLSHALHPRAGATATANVTIADLDVDIDAVLTGDEGWTQVRFTFTATDTAETLAIRGVSSAGDQQAGVMIDGVSIAGIAG